MTIMDINYSSVLYVKGVILIQFSNIMFCSKIINYHNHSFLDALEVEIQTKILALLINILVQCWQRPTEYLIYQIG